MNYNKLTDDDKRVFLHQEYEINKKSFQHIAESCGTYANKVRRDAIRLKIKIRDKSEAQKNALNNGSANHPTMGKSRSDTIKQKIGMSVLKSWENLDSKELAKRKQKARKNWENKPDDEKELILKQANTAVRESSKTGTKLEKFLHKELLACGYSVDFHKEQSILNTKLQIDLFLPNNNIAIEIDGPSHFEPVWGSDALKRNKKYDNKKTGLILGKGLFLIRIKQSQDFSKARGLLILQDLIQTIKDIDTGTITDNKVIFIGE